MNNSMLNRLETDDTGIVNNTLERSFICYERKGKKREEEEKSVTH